MDFQSKPTSKISEETRKAKLAFLSTSSRPNYTTIWETITIEETVNDDQHGPIIKERIPFDLTNLKNSTNLLEFDQRPSTSNGELIYNRSRASANDEFPSSTKSLSPKHLKRAVLNNKFQPTNHMNNRTLNDFNNDLIQRNIHYPNDYYKFKNRPLSPSECQLEKWKEIKRFKNQYANMNKQVNPLHNATVETDQQLPIHDQLSFLPSLYQQTSTDNQMLSSSSFDQSFDQTPIENSDYYGSLDEHTNTDQDKDIDHSTNFEDNYSENNQSDLSAFKLSTNRVEENQQTGNYQDEIKSETDYDYTPRTSIISELNEHNFIDEDADENEKQLDENYLNQNYYEQYLEDNQSKHLDNLINNQLNSQVNNQIISADNKSTDQLNNQEKIDEEFDKLLLNYPNIEKFVNNLNSLANSPIEQKVDQRHSGSITRSPLFSEPQMPNEVLEIEEPLILSRDISRQKNIDQIVKRKSVVVQTSRPTSLQTTVAEENDDDVQHLLTIVKKNQLVHYAPIKDVYVINRTIYQIQKLSSFILEYRALLNLIQNKLHTKLFQMDDNELNQKSSKKTTDKWSKIKLILKWFISHLFSTPGLCFILIFYCVLGAMLFELLEQENNQKEIEIVKLYRNKTVHDLFALNSSYPYKNKREWIDKATSILIQFEEEIIKKVDMNGYSGNVPEKWSFSDSFLYSVTVISTIGYGKLSPKTFAGQICTILYAVVGIPIMLLFITNLGTLLASIFRVSYDTICCYICNLNKNKQSNQNEDNSNTQPVTVSEQLTDPKSIELTKIRKADNTDPKKEQSNNVVTDSPRSIQDHETEDSIVVFQNNEYHSKVKERAYYLTYNGEPIQRNRVPIRVVLLIVFFVSILLYLCYLSYLYLSIFI